MKKISLIAMMLPMTAFGATEAETALLKVVDNVRTQCLGISSELAPLKTLAGVGTAVNAVGTVTGVAGTAVGIAKYNEDSKIASDKLKVLEESEANKKAKEDFAEIYRKINDDELKKQIKALVDEHYSRSYTSAGNGTESESQKKSNTLGNVRTGLFATNTATNVAGSVISSQTMIKTDVIDKITACKESLEELRSARLRVRVEDGANANAGLLDQSQIIITACGEYGLFDTGSLNKLAKGATWTGAIGATTGAAATITSALGTNKKMSDITKQSDADKIQNINTASNVLGGVTAVSSLVGTALNASQIKKIKQLITISENCEGALKW